MPGDPFSRVKRAAIMRAVKSADTTPERAVRAAACAAGFSRRYRLNVSALPGTPDLAFVTLRKAVFVHGCFWHGHTCKRGARKPTANAAYWRAKISRNANRDRAAVRALRALGWRVLVIWECKTRDAAALQRNLTAFLRA